MLDLTDEPINICPIMQASDYATRLNEIRLDEGLTFEQLADQVGIETSTLYRFLRQSDRQPFERTLHKVRRFLDERKATSTKPRRQGRLS